MSRRGRQMGSYKSDITHDVDIAKEDKKKGDEFKQIDEMYKGLIVVTDGLESQICTLKEDILQLKHRIKSQDETFREYVARKWYKKFN